MAYCVHHFSVLCKHLLFSFVRFWEVFCLIVLDILGVESPVSSALLFCFVFLCMYVFSLIDKN